MEVREKVENQVLEKVREVVEEAVGFFLRKIRRNWASTRVSGKLAQQKTQISLPAAVSAYNQAHPWLSLPTAVPVHVCLPLQSLSS